jgi:hypothetical protein
VDEPGEDRAEHRVTLLVDLLHLDLRQPERRQADGRQQAGLEPGVVHDVPLGRVLEGDLVGALLDNPGDHQVDDDPVVSLGPPQRLDAGAELGPGGVVKARPSHDQQLVPAGAQATHRGVGGAVASQQLG